jgi:hypothetical protein
MSRKASKYIVNLSNVLATSIFPALISNNHGANLPLDFKPRILAVKSQRTKDTP